MSEVAELYESPFYKGRFILTEDSLSKSCSEKKPFEVFEKNFYDLFGKDCFVFELPLLHGTIYWNKTFWDLPSERINCLGFAREKILVSEKGVFFLMTELFQSKTFARCQQPYIAVFKYGGYDADARCWSFDHLNTDEKTLMDEAFFYRVGDRWEDYADPNVECPAELLEKVADLKILWEAPFLSEEVTLSAEHQALLDTCVQRKITSVRKFKNFNFFIFNEPEKTNFSVPARQIVSVVGYLVLVEGDEDADGSQQKQVLLMEDYPGNKMNVIDKNLVFWQHDPKMRGYCCGDYENFYHTLFPETPFPKLDGEEDDDDDEEEEEEEDNDDKDNDEGENTNK